LIVRTIFLRWCYKFNLRLCISKWMHSTRLLFHRKRVLLHLTFQLKKVSTVKNIATILLNKVLVLIHYWINRYRWIDNHALVGVGEFHLERCFFNVFYNLSVFFDSDDTWVLLGLLLYLDPLLQMLRYQIVKWLNQREDLVEADFGDIGLEVLKIVALFDKFCQITAADEGNFRISLYLRLSHQKHLYIPISTTNYLQTYFHHWIVRRYFELNLDVIQVFLNIWRCWLVYLHNYKLLLL